MNAQEASNVVEQALRSVLADAKDFEPGDILTDWVLVGYCTNPDSEKGATYPMLFADGEIPTYRAIGLLTIALDSLKDEVGPTDSD